MKESGKPARGLFLKAGAMRAPGREKSRSGCVPVVARKKSASILLMLKPISCDRRLKRSLRETIVQKASLLQSSGPSMPRGGAHGFDRRGGMRARLNGRHAAPLSAPKHPAEWRAHRR